ncbi:MAG: GDSL-type esterase/lipase family protein [Candidatus Methylacidiphilales bacterium]|nr:GDSL-type esterase/lipase family protein [Candidatus Methylacidiphilales bacterium]
MPTLEMTEAEAGAETAEALAAATESYSDNDNDTDSIVAEETTATVISEPHPLEGEIRRWERITRDLPPPAKNILFYGSSTIRLWNETLEGDFPELPVVCRGFGGSDLEEGVLFFDRLVIPCRPSMLVVYAGENDLVHGRTADQVVQSWREIVRHTRLHLGSIPVVFISLKPSPSRLHLREAVLEVNRRIKAICAESPRLLRYVDVYNPMLDDNGNARLENFSEDQLHLSRKGYELWATLLQKPVRDAYNYAIGV